MDGDGDVGSMHIKQVGCFLIFFIKILIKLLNIFILMSLNFKNI